MINSRQLHNTRLLLEWHQIMAFQGGFSTEKYDNITKLIKNSKYESFKSRRDSKAT